MGENSSIEWCDHTFNPWVGCTKISPACDHCYAESWAKRAGSPELWDGERRRTTPSNWRKPIQWNARAAKLGRRYRVFCASLADVFDNTVPSQWRDDLWTLVRQTPHLDWLLLTKRIGNAIAMDVPYLDNVWLGATVVTQTEADRDVPKLIGAPARIKFLSVEPLLEEIDLRGHLGILGGIDWVILGGESGPNARAMSSAWCERILRDCRRAAVPFFFKQGSAANWIRFKEFDSFAPVFQVREFPRP